jgi:2,3-bisphosphoglycerate-independent phosphoglycerate mutase
MRNSSTFAPTQLKNTLGEIVGRAGLTQLHVAESEKYAHVTFFFNGGRQQPFSGEKDICVPSPKGRPFEEVPELSLPGVAQAVQHGIQDRCDLIVVNFANGDVIGHTSNREAKIRCAEIVDSRLAEVVQAALAGEYAVMVTADHGNLELMTNPDGSPHVSHTDNPVPFVYLEGRKSSGLQIHNGSLGDVAPTILRLLGLDPPAEMNSPGLLSSEGRSARRRVLLIILDGWGIGRQDDTNPIFLAGLEQWKRLTQENPYSQLQAAGEAVGLRAGKAGNSEAGHMNLGAGRLIPQDDVRLDLAMQDGSFSENATLCRVIDEVRKKKTGLHLIGLLSEKSSHGSIDYPLEVLRMAQRRGLQRVYLHLIFDGRSTAPGSAPDLLVKLDGQLKDLGAGRIASGTGRGIALDRDGNYAKTRRAYEAIVDGVGMKCAAGA